MLSTKHLVNDIWEVPSTFVFEHYLGLGIKLKGQDVRIKSLFNEEKTPSMWIYHDKVRKVYKFKCFSSGKQGSHIDLVKELFGLDFHNAARLIVEDYNNYVLTHGEGYDDEELKEHEKFRVDHYECRQWNTEDQAFWTPFNIGSRLLEEHCVRPLECYRMAKKDENGERREINICGPHLYGYFRKDGTLYKIYQPKLKEKKFIKVSSYIQGLDQLKGYRFLAITSSLKDIMALKSLRLHLDYVAPDSENTMIPQGQMEEFLQTYDKVLVLFDYDEPGIKAMLKYREQYGTPGLILPLSKDPSDSIRDFGPKQVRNTLVPIIDRNINLVVELNEKM